MRYRLALGWVSGHHAICVMTARPTAPQTDAMSPQLQTAGRVPAEVSLNDDWQRGSASAMRTLLTSTERLRIRQP
jgi:hypothetical protein